MLKSTFFIDKCAYVTNENNSQTLNLLAKLLKQYQCIM